MSLERAKGIFGHVDFDAIDYRALRERSHWLRNELFEMANGGRKGHIPSSYSCAEVVVSLYYGGILRVDSQNPSWPDRDRFIVSKGHAGMVAYPILADMGFIDKAELKKFVTKDGILRMYPDPDIPGIESITGSLAHSLGVAAGFSLAAKMDGKNYNSFVILSDGECYEGATWEHALYAAPQRQDSYAGHTGLNNLVAIVDNNGCCITDKTDKCVRLNPLEPKWESFGWYVQNVNGHSYKELMQAFRNIHNKDDSRPSVIVANTIKGKGISFMEDRPGWHNKRPNDEQIAMAREELQHNTIE